MAFLRPDFDSYFPLGGSDTTLPGSSADQGVFNPPEDSFDLFGCPDMFKESEITLEQLTATVAETAQCEANLASGSDQSQNVIYGYFDYGNENELLQRTGSPAGELEDVVPMDEAAVISQGFQDLEDFLAKEYQDQLTDAQISQPQPAAAPAPPAETTKSLSSQQLSSNSTLTNPLLFKTSSFFSSSSSSQFLSESTLLSSSIATPTSSIMTLQLEALDPPRPTSERQSDDVLFDLKTGLPVENKRYVSFPESNSSFSLGAQDTFDSYNGGSFAVEFQLTDFSSTDLDLITQNSQNHQELNYVTNQGPHVRFEDSQVLKSDNLALSHFGLGKSYLPSSELSEFNEDSDYGAFAQATPSSFNAEEEIEDRPLSSFKDGNFGLRTNDASSSFLSTVPRTMPTQKGIPLSAEGSVQLGLEIRKSIANMSKVEYSKFAAKHEGLVTPKATGTSANREKKQVAPKTDDQFRVSKADRAKKPRKVKRQFSYANVKVDATLVYTPNLQNTARNLLNKNFEYETKLVDLLDQGESAIGRKRYQRDNIDPIRGLHPNVSYERNPFFDVNRPYQQEFTRVELDPKSGEPIMETRSALCAYCDDINFYELKNSCYSQHMSHSHGIYTDDYLTPDPLLFGRYQVAKKATAGRKTRPRIRCHEGVVCPACFEVVEVRCWSSTMEKKPLSNYLRHFKESHRVDKRKATFFNLHV